MIRHRQYMIGYFPFEEHKRTIQNFRLQCAQLWFIVSTLHLSSWTQTCTTRAMESQMKSLRWERVVKDHHTWGRRWTGFVREIHPKTRRPHSFSSLKEGIVTVTFWSKTSFTDHILSCWSKLLLRRDGKLRVDMSDPLATDPHPSDRQQSCRFIKSLVFPKESFRLRPARLDEQTWVSQFKRKGLVTQRALRF